MSLFDHKSKKINMPNENTPLRGDVERAKPATRLRAEFHLETLRVIGLAAGIVLLFVGKTVTETFVDFPEGSGGWHPEETFIYKMFHFNHTCTYLDFNPSKTVAALVLQLHSVPMCLYIFLAHFRIKYDWTQNQIPKALYMYSKITTPIIFVVFLYFYMVFVNSPYGKMSQFILHYIPYMLWQTGMVLMAIEQCWYISYKSIIPWNVDKQLLRYYCVFLVLMEIYYTWFVWSFIAGHPILDTTVHYKNILGQCIMYGFDFFAVVVPLVFALKERTDGNVNVIEFYDRD